MKQLWRLFILLIAVMGSYDAAAQDTILLLSGRKVVGEVLDIKETKVFYKKNKAKQKSIDNERVFAVIYEDEREEFVYKQDTLVDNDFSTDQMKVYIQGINDARLNYKARWASIAGVVVGGASSYMGEFWGLAPIGLYIALVGSGSPKIKTGRVSNETMMNNQLFKRGYQQAARGKKMKNAAIGSGIGFIVGLSILSIVY